MTTQATTRRTICRDLRERQLCLLHWLEAELAKLPPVEQSPQAAEITKAEVAKTKRVRALGPVNAKAKARRPAPKRATKTAVSRKRLTK